ncbi:MAG TPA: hypothetical protein VEO75_01480, partial [Nitrososphaerales archaeon]|nr:hypothetical protein [Nitrososphaerales archaeon]
FVPSSISILRNLKYPAAQGRPLRSVVEPSISRQAPEVTDVALVMVLVLPVEPRLTSDIEGSVETEVN